MYYITLETLNILKYWDFKLLSTQGLTGILAAFPADSDIFSKTLKNEKRVVRNNKMPGWQTQRRAGRNGHLMEASTEKINTDGYNK